MTLRQRGKDLLDQFLGRLLGRREDGQRPTPRQQAERGARWLVLAAAFVAAWAAILYVQGYDHAFGNVAITAPQIEATIDSSLLRADICHQQVVQSSPRIYMNRLVALPVQLGLTDVAGACLVWFVLSMGSYFVGLGRIGVALHGRVAGVVLAFLGLAATKATIGSTDIMHAHRHFEAAIPAMAIAIWGVYCCCRERWVLGYGLFGAASVLQFLVGFHAGALLLPVLLVKATRARQPSIVVKPLIPLACGLALVYLPMLFSGASSSAKVSNEQFVFLWAHVRNPHHMSPSAWSSGHWYELVFFTVGGVMVILAARTLPTTVRAIMLTVVGGTWLGLLLNYLFVDLWPIALVAKLQFARCTNYNKLMILTAIAVVAAECVSRKRIALAVLLVLAPLDPFRSWYLPLVGLAALEARHATDDPPRWASAASWGLVLLAAVHVFCHDGKDFVTTAAVLERVTYPRLVGIPLYFALLGAPFVVSGLLASRRSGRAFVLASAAASLALFVVWTLRSPPGWLGRHTRRVVTRFEPRRPEEILAHRLRDVIDADAVVLVPPGFESFQHHSLRAAVVTFKCIPFSESGLVEWGERMGAVLGVPVGIQTSWRGDISGPFYGRPGADLAKVARHYGARYILTRAGSHGTVPGRPLMREGQWIVYDLEGSDHDG